MLPIANCMPPIGFQPDDVFVSAYTAAAITAGTVVQFDFANATTFGVNEVNSSGVPTSGFGCVIASTVTAVANSCKIIGVMAETSVAGGIGKVQIRGICEASILGAATKGFGLKVGIAGFNATTTAGDSACALNLKTVAAASTSTVLLFGIGTGFGQA